VGNLSFRTRERDLDDEFGRFGKLTDVFIPMDQDGRSRGFGRKTRDTHACTHV
jgi:RNA recognition motif-containing protein